MATTSRIVQRAQVARAVRDLFDGQGFVEVDTPLRVRSPGQEVHLDAVASEDRWLHTSPEYAMKRVLAAGPERIYQLCHVFRRGERGPHHLPEFTMLEWYRARSPLGEVMADCEGIVEAAARAAGTSRDVWRAPFERATVAELCARHAGVEVSGEETVSDLAARAARAGIRVAPGAAWDDVFFQIWLDRVEPAIAARGPKPLFVTEWPAPLAALARRFPDRPALAERFELYAGGLELCNAFAELSDPVEQRARFEEERRLRAARGKDVYPVDEALLAALPAIEGASGAAMGFDRLLMLVTGAERIDDVVALVD